MGLSPPACAVGGLGLALGVYVAYWLTFVLYVWGVCWALALLWLVPRYLEERDWRRGLGVAFAVYSLVLTAYPQQAVWHAWLLLLVAGQAFARRPRVRPLVGLALWGALGLACSAPVALDVLWDTLESARTKVEPGFFFETLPAFESSTDVATFFSRLYDASWFGNPVGHEYPFKIRGVSWTPVLAVLMALSFAGGGLRRWWPWQLFLAATLLVTLWPAAYRFGIEWLGLGLSRHAPLAGAHVPLAVLAALAAERLYAEGRPGRAAGLALGLVPLALALPGAFLTELHVEGGFFGASLFFLSGVLLFVWNRNTTLLVAIALTATLHYALQVRLEVPRDEALKTGGIATRIEAGTAGGARYAWVGRQYKYLLRPNQETLFGLRSVHSYDSLSSAAYQGWVERFSTGGTQTYGRQFRRVTDASLLDSESLAAAGVGLIVSFHDLPPDLAEREHVTRGLGFWRPRVAPVLEAQLEGYGASLPYVWTEDGVLGSPRQPLERSADESDRLVFQVTPLERESLLFVSQQHDERWVARADGEPVPVVQVDDFFLGALVPPGAGEVVLEFRPFARWAWLPQVLLGLGAVAALVRRRRSP
jgi:hypothetical protein